MRIQKLNRRSAQRGCENLMGKTLATFVQLRLKLTFNLGGGATRGYFTSKETEDRRTAAAHLCSQRAARA